MDLEDVWQAKSPPGALSGEPTGLWDDEATLLNENQKLEVNHLLEEFADIFSEPQGHANIQAQEIHINHGCKPCMQRPYTISPAKSGIMDKKIENLIEKGYLEPCVSE